MKKIISLFERNYETDRLIRNEVVPGAEWVQAGEGVATRKWDGICCMVRDGKLYKRYDAKPGRTPPPSFEPVMEPDSVTGHHVGWIPVNDGPENWQFRKPPMPEEDGTYELVGPSINKNPDDLAELGFIRHGMHPIPDAPRFYDDLKLFLSRHNIEGLVWHHPDGRMVKIKKRDFGIKR